MTSTNDVGAAFLARAASAAPSTSTTPAIAAAEPATSPLARAGSSPTTTTGRSSTSTSSFAPVIGARGARWRWATRTWPSCSLGWTTWGCQSGSHVPDSLAIGSVVSYCQARPPGSVQRTDSFAVVRSPSVETDSTFTAAGASTFAAVSDAVILWVFSATSFAWSPA
jgi:hypothetical protein